MRSKI